MTTRNRDEVRIAIGGRYLDEVQIRLARQYGSNSVSYLSFPAHRHEAWWDGERVTVWAQAATVVKLFADGVLPPVGGPSVIVEVGGQKIGPCLLESVESGGTEAVDDIIVLRFRRSGEAVR